MYSPVLAQTMLTLVCPPSAYPVVVKPAVAAKPPLGEYSWWLVLNRAYSRVSTCRSRVEVMWPPPEVCPLIMLVLSVRSSVCMSSGLGRAWFFCRPRSARRFSARSFIVLCGMNRMCGQAITHAILRVIWGKWLIFILTKCRHRHDRTNKLEIKFNHSFKGWFSNITIKSMHTLWFETK